MTMPRQEKPTPRRSALQNDSGGDSPPDEKPDAPSSGKMWRLVFAVLLTIICGFVGWYCGSLFLETVLSDSTLYKFFQGGVAVLYSGVFVTVGGVFGFALGGVLFRRIEVLGDRLSVLSARDKVFLIGGVSVGLILTAVLSLPIFAALGPKPLSVLIALLMGAVVTYLSTVLSLSMREELHLYFPPPEDQRIPKEKFKILDTNVIIDGRIADVAKAGFMDGPLYIPGFVLDELQHIADSSDSLKRARGRRGLDILNQMDKEFPLVVRQYDRLAPPTGEVDARLVQLAKTLGGSLVTNDWNLNRVAVLQDVHVLNVNELANALKPVVLPGEEMSVQIVKEGKDPDQGVGYLDDGTMIVVGGGRRHMGETVEIVVNSLMQTVQGKMIFAHLRSDDEENNGDGYEQRNGVRPYTGGGPRRPVRRAGQ